MSTENYVQAYAPDKQALAELVIEAKGTERTMAQFAIDTGISAPTLSRIANGKFDKPLLKSLLVRIYNAKSENANFSLEKLFLTNGMVNEAVVDRGKNYVSRMVSNRDRFISAERHAKNAIVTAILDRGSTVQTIPRDLDNRRNEAPFGIHLPYDFCLYLPDEEYPLWYFEVLSGFEPKVRFSYIHKHADPLFLLDAWAPEFVANQKTSFVFEDRKYYEQFILQYKGAPIKTAVTAILIDADRESILEETWISQSPAVPGILAREVTNSGSIAIWVSEDYSPNNLEDEE